MRTRVTMHATASASSVAWRQQQRQDQEINDWVRSMLPGCHRHGRDCRVPWGYDEAHTDSDRPYTVDELATRKSGPHRFAYSTYEEYILGWKLWLALRRDAGMSRAESDVVWNLRLDRMEAKAAAMGQNLSDLIAEFRR